MNNFCKAGTKCFSFLWLVALNLAYFIDDWCAMKRKMELSKVATKPTIYWNRQIFYACCTLVLMMVGFAALYCGVYFGLNDQPPQHINQSTPYSNENDVTKITSPPSSLIQESQCAPRNLAFCNNTLNYTETVYPNFSGDKSEDDLVRSWAFMQTVIDSNCHPLIEQFVCQAAQPECRQNDPIGPCRQLCLDVAKACDSHIWSILEKEKIMFNCYQYTDLDDMNLCYSSKSTSTDYVNAKI